MAHSITITEEQRQLILLAMAQLSLERPGWHYALSDAARQFSDGRTTFAQFHAIEEDPARPGPWIPAAERLPAEPGCYLAWMVGYRPGPGFQAREGCVFAEYDPDEVEEWGTPWTEVTEHGDALLVSHWMPLPGKPG